MSVYGALCNNTQASRSSPGKKSYILKYSGLKESESLSKSHPQNTRFLVAGINAKLVLCREYHDNLQCHLAEQIKRILLEPAS